MRKSTAGITVTSSAVAVGLMGALPAAAADPYIDPAIEQLANTKAYADPGVTLAGMGQIASNLSSSNVAVAALPEGAVNTLSATSVAGMIQEKTGRDTIIVVIERDGKDAFGVASTGDAAAITEALYTNNNTDNGGDAVLAAMDTIIAKSSVTATGTVDTKGGPAAADGTGIGLVGGAGLFLGLVVIAAVAMKFRHKLKQVSAQNASTNITYDELPEELRKQLQEYQRIVRKHAQTADQVFMIRLESILKHLQELFRRLDKKGQSHQARMASVTYVDVLGKLNRALSEDYYLDIAANPTLWSNPQERLAEVRQAVVATDDQLVDNIKQVNASQDLDFQVALESLTSNMDNPEVDDLYGGENRRQRN